MRLIFLLPFIFSVSAFSGLEQIGVKNLSLNYTDPTGQGSVDHLQIGLSKTGAHLIEVEKAFDNFVVKTSMLEFTWIDPWRFLLESEKVNLDGVNVHATNQRLEFSASSALLKKGDEISVKNIKVNCQGMNQRTKLEEQLMENCRQWMMADADKLDLPLDLLPIDVLSRMPLPEEERPLKNFTMSIQNGSYSFFYYTNVIVRAGLRSKGTISFEDDMKVIAVKVDQIKFGVLPVTAIVMKALRDRINDPRVEIKPPYIRVRIKE